MLSKEQFEALTVEEQNAYVQSHIDKLDTQRRLQMQQRVIEKMKRDHKKQHRLDVKLLGSRQVKKLVKQARRDAKTSLAEQA